MLHPDESPITIEAVDAALRASGSHRRVRAPFAQGTDNLLFALTDGTLARVARTPGAAARLAVEVAHLPLLPASLPAPRLLEVVTGPPPLIVVTCLPGQSAAPAGLGPAGAAILAQYLAALAGMPLGQARPGHRAHTLADRDAETRAALDDIAEVDGGIDERHHALWQAALAAGERPFRFTHGDLLPGNVLVRGGLPVGVVDLGCSGLADPAVDVAAAWTLCSVEGRGRLRELLDVDDGCWAAARGWALSIAALIIPYYRSTLPSFAASARSILEQTVSDG
jgi:aminoglycoside phosphotransferase (APT) family kinase protein